MSVDLVGEGDAVLNLYLLVLALEFCPHLDLLCRTRTTVISVMQTRKSAKMRELESYIN